MKILYPPHPKGKIGRKRLPRYERTGNYLAQLKFNGTHVVICVTADGDVYVLTRHGEPSKRFQLTEKHIKEFLSLDLEKGQGILVCWGAFPHTHYVRRIQQGSGRTHCAVRFASSW